MSIDLSPDATAIIKIIQINACVGFISLSGVIFSGSINLPIVIKFGALIKKLSEYKFMDTPFVCNMNTLSEAQRRRYQEITENLHVSRQSVKELSDGYAFRFKCDAQMILETAEFIVYERLCCPFFNFELTVEQDTNRLWLRLRGQEGIKEFIRFEFKIIED